MNTGSVVATRCAANAATVTAPPSSRSGRRPKRSAAQPTTGRNARAATENAPMPTPTPRPLGAERSAGEPGRDREDEATGGEERQRRREQGEEGRRDERWSRVGRRLAHRSRPGDRLQQTIGGRVRIESMLRDVLDDGCGEWRQGRLAEPVGQPIRQDAADLGQRPGSPRIRGQALAVGRPVPIERGEELGDALAGGGRRDEDLRPLRRGSVRRGIAARHGRHEHGPQLGRGAQGARLVALVDHDEIGDLEQAGLDGLDLVAHLGRLEHDGRVGGGRHLDLALARADRLDQHQVEARCVHARRRRPWSSTPGRRRVPGMPSTG